MRLASFLKSNIEPVLQEWENFARTIPTDNAPMDREALRDHAETMLRTIIADLETFQSEQQKVDKSRGLLGSEGSTPAKSHAATRLLAGFTIEQVTSEFRAMRSSVISLWMRQVQIGEGFEAEDMIRFNEAVDQALAESISSYAAGVQTSRNIFLGILGHDLRTPLSAILLGADVLLRTDELGARSTKIASRIYASVKRASHIVGDLLDFVRSQVSGGIPITRALIDLAPLYERIVDESRAVHPEAMILSDTAGSTFGEFDGSRLEQVFSNLIGNAVQHGARHLPITTTLSQADDDLLLTVHNMGDAIPEDVLPFIFNPMGRYSPEALSGNGPYASLGLGLFIVDQIVTAHEGTIDVSSTAEAGTTFTVKLPVKSHSSPIVKAHAVTASGAGR